jgi:hypothetical protein
VLDICVADSDFDPTTELLFSISDWDPYEYPYEEELMPASQTRNDPCNNSVFSFKRRGFSAAIRIWRMSICHVNPRSNNYIEDKVVLDTKGDSESAVFLRYPSLDHLFSALFQWRAECDCGPHYMSLIMDIKNLIRYNMRTVLLPNYADEFIAEQYKTTFMEWVLQRKAHPKGSLYVRKEGGQAFYIKRFRFEGPDGYFVDCNGDPEKSDMVHERVGELPS